VTVSRVIGLVLLTAGVTLTGYRPPVGPTPLAIGGAESVGKPIGLPRVRDYQSVKALRDIHFDFGKATIRPDDEEILDAQRLLARTEGLFVEPASATPIALLRKFAMKDVRRVVCVTTGHGLKDPDALTKAPVLMERVKPELDALKRLLDA